MVTNPKMVNLYDVAERLGISYSAAQKLASKGELPCRKVGAVWRCDPERLAEYCRQIQGGTDV